MKKPKYHLYLTPDFELLGNTFLFCKLFYEPVIHVLCFFVDVSEVIDQLVLGE